MQKSKQLSWQCLDQLLRFKREVRRRAGGLAAVKPGPWRAGHAAQAWPQRKAYRRPPLPTNTLSTPAQASDDIRLNLRLFRRCVNDQKKFCGDVEPGHARVQVCAHSGPGHRGAVCLRCLLQLFQGSRVVNFGLELTPPNNSHRAPTF
jgi:hypothetical protein